jgi:hypothetical protein
MSVATVDPRPAGHMGRRFAAHFEARPDLVTPLPADNPSVLAGRSIFSRQVVDAETSPRLLVSGAHQRKIGNLVTKGKWKGLPIYTLTLEERATCPESCALWRSCYGTSMPFARRHSHGSALERRLDDEIAHLNAAHPQGFVVRLHILGDFYDPAYAALWARWLEAYQALHVFGYTAHSPLHGVGWLVQKLNILFPSRCVIRFSGEQETGAALRARTIWRKPEYPRVPEGIVCPAQTERTACCGTCGLCWATSDTIVFIGHGRIKRGAKERTA